MKRKYNVIIMIAVIGVICFLAVLTANTKKYQPIEREKISVRPTIDPLIDELKQTQKEVKRKIAEAQAQLSASPLQSADDYTSPPINITIVNSKSVLDKIKKLAPNFEVTIWNENGELATEGQVPYEVILNGSVSEPVVSDCDGAKKLSYYMLESMYKDSDVRPTLSRIMITIPYYLRVSLGARDGVPMAQNDSFSGPTNFWVVMEKMGLGENERGELENRTWGNYLTRCE